MRIMARWAVAFVAFSLTASCMPTAAQTPADSRKSGYEFMGPDTRAMQDDDGANPGMLTVLDGAALWTHKDGKAGKACADCHDKASSAMRGVAARYPARDQTSKAVVDIEARIALCQTRYQKAEPSQRESRELLALSTYIARQSRGAVISPSNDVALQQAIARGRKMYSTRRGQLNLSCASCHDDNAGERLGGSVVPQAHPTGYPIYRLEWQGVGSLQRRLRNCLAGMRTQPPPYGANDYTDLEAFLMWRARGMIMETPAVRP